jgi:hypothetical protein
MKHLLSAGALVALASASHAQGFPPPPIQDGFHVNGEVLATYGNTHYGTNDFLVQSKLFFNGATAVGDMRATVRGELVLRTDTDDLPTDMDDVYNLEIALETGALGTFGYSTYHRCAGVGFPWTDGDVGNLGSANIHPWVPPTYRCAGGLQVYLPQGALDADDHFFYRNQIGGLRINAWYDHDLNYAHTDQSAGITIDGELAPEFELELGYDAKFAMFMLGGNDVGDRKAGIMVPLGQSGFTVGYEYNHLDAATEMTGQIVNVDYRPTSPSILRNVRATYWLVEAAGGASFENWMIDARFGHKDWELGVAYEGQGNFAMEGAYKLRDNLSIVAGYDSGFDTGDGWSGAFGPATSVPGRGDSYEIGVKLTF